MAVTTSYVLQLLGNSIVTAYDGATVYANGAATVGLDDGSFATAVNDYDTSEYPDGQVRLNFSTKTGGYASSFVLEGWDPSVAALSNETVGLVWNTPDGHVRFRPFDVESSADASVDLGTGRNADIAARQNGNGFVVAWEAPLDNGYSNIALGIASGNNGSGFFSFNVKFGATIDRNPSVAYLGDGNIVVAWDRTDASGNSAIWYAVFDEGGGVVTAPTLYDANGSRNVEPSVAAIGTSFSIAYEDNEAFGGVSEIAFFNRSGDGRNVSYHRVAAPDGSENGPDTDPSTTKLGQIYATTFTHTALDQGQDREVSVYLSLTDPLTGASLNDPNKPLLVGSNISQASIAAIPHDAGRVVISYTDENDGQVHQQIARVVETIVGDAAGQTLRGSRGVAVSIDGGGGDDTMTETQGDDRLFGNTGNDVLMAQDGDYGKYSGNDVYDGGDGIDTLDFSGFFGSVTVDLSITGPQKTDGTDALDTILRIENLTGSGFGADRLTGNTGDNVLDDGGPNRYTSQILKDTLIGGLGSDTYIVSDSVDVVIESSASGGTDLVKSRASSFTLSANVENLTLLAEAGAASATGNSIVNVLTGNAADNVLDGKGGADRMAGLAGNDTYFVDNSGDRVIEATKQGGDIVYTSVGYTLAAGQEIESLEAASAAATTGLKLTGNEFRQNLKGTAGADILDGKGGADLMVGRQGSDIYYVDSGSDRVIEAAKQGSDVVYTSSHYGLTAGQEIEALEALSATATTGLTLTGNEFRQTIKGGAGSDVLDGQGGADLLVGRAGNDTYFIDDPLDRVIEAAGQGSDVVYARANYTLIAGQAIEALEAASAVGTVGYALTGNELSQNVKGNAGANVLDGKGGIDTLYGRAGADTFVFSTALGSSNVDRIGDFSHADDTIRLAKSVFTALSAGKLDAGAFKDVAAGRIDGDDRILYNHDTGALSYDADGSGSKAAVQFAILLNKPTNLVFDDFLIV